MENEETKAKTLKEVIMSNIKNYSIFGYDVYKSYLKTSHL